MRKNILLFSYLAFFGSGCFSTNPTGTDHKDTGFSYEVKSFDHICEVKESFQNYMNSQKEHIKSEFDRISEIMRTPEKRDVMLARALVAGGTSLLVIGSFAAIVHASPLLLLGSAGIAVCSLINKSEIDTFPQAWGQGLAIGLTSGMIIAGSAGINQLAHLSHDSGHTTPVHHSGDSNPIDRRLSDFPQTHNVHTPLTPESNVQALKDFEGAINATKKIYGDHSLRDMSTHLHEAEVAAEKALNEAQNPSTISEQEGRLNLHNIGNAISNAHPEDPNHHGNNFGMVPQGGNSYVASDIGNNPWERSRSEEEIRALEDFRQKIKEAENNHMHNGSGNTGHDAGKPIGAKAAGDTVTGKPIDTHKVYKAQKANEAAHKYAGDNAEKAFDGLAKQISNHIANEEAHKYAGDNAEKAFDGLAKQISNHIANEEAHKLAHEATHAYTRMYNPDSTVDEIIRNAKNAGDNAEKALKALEKLNEPTENDLKKYLESIKNDSEKTIKYAQNPDAQREQLGLNNLKIFFGADNRAQVNPEGFAEFNAHHPAQNPFHGLAEQISNQDIDGSRAPIT